MLLLLWKNLWHRFDATPKYRSLFSSAYLSLSAKMMSYGSRNEICSRSEFSSFWPQYLCLHWERHLTGIGSLLYQYVDYFYFCFFFIYFILLAPLTQALYYRVGWASYTYSATCCDLKDVQYIFRLTLSNFKNKNENIQYLNGRLYESLCIDTHHMDFKQSKYLC